MKFFDDVICPISHIKIDSHVSRLTVFMNAILLALYVLTGLPYLVVIVAIDYGIRATWKPAYSPLRWVAVKIISATGIPEKRIDQAPKLFASRVGFLFALTSTLLLPVTAMASLAVGSILLVFTILDSVFDLCVGCITYAYIVLPFYQYMGVREKI